RIGKAWQRGPRCEKSLLDNVLGLLEVAGERQRRTECEGLEPSLKLHEGSNAAPRAQPPQRFGIHGLIPAHKVPGNDPALKGRAELFLRAADVVDSIWKISDKPALPDDVSWSARLPDTLLSHPSCNRRSRIRAPTSPLR